MILLAMVSRSVDASHHIPTLLDCSLGPIHLAPLHHSDISLQHGQLYTSCDQMMFCADGSKATIVLQKLDVSTTQHAS